MPDPSPRILLRIPDLMAEVRVQAALAADGLSAETVSVADWPGAVTTARPPALAVVDLAAPGAVGAVALAAAGELTVVAFGPHVDAAALSAARDAGATTVLARGDFLQHAARRVREALGTV